MTFANCFRYAVSQRICFMVKIRIGMEFWTRKKTMETAVSQRTMPTACCSAA